MANKDCGRGWKAQQGGHGLDVMVPMNDVGWRAELIEIVDDGDRRRPDLCGNVTVDPRVDDRPMPSGEKRNRKVANVE